MSCRAEIVTWKGGSTRQLTVALKHEIYNAFADMAAQRDLSKAELGRLVIESMVRHPAAVAAMFAEREVLP